MVQFRNVKHVVPEEDVYFCSRLPPYFFPTVKASDGGVRGSCELAQNSNENDVAERRNETPSVGLAFVAVAVVEK